MEIEKFKNLLVAESKKVFQDPILRMYYYDKILRLTNKQLTLIMNKYLLEDGTINDPVKAFKNIKSLRTIK